MGSHAEDEYQDAISSDDELKFSAQLSGSSVILSPSSEYMAIIISGRLIIRDVKTLVTINVFSCIDKIERCEFSPDSSFILCAMFSRNAVQVFSVTDSEWKCRINEGIAGVVNATWAPDSRSIITESDFGIQLTIWSLIDNSSFAIAYPKQPFVATSSGTAQSVTQTTRSYGGSLFAFSDCGKYLAVVHRVELNDHIGIYTTAPWTEIAKFKGVGNDTSSIAWTPQGTHVVVTDSPLTYKLHFYSIKGDHEGSFEGYRGGLGVRSVQFYRPDRGKDALSAEARSSSRLMAVSSFDGKVRLITTTKWNVAFTYSLTHPKEMDAGVIHISEDEEDPDQPILVGSYPVTVEVNQAPAAEHIFSSGGADSVGSTFIKKQLKVLPKVLADPRDAKGLPAMGVAWMGWSADGSVIAAREESFPRCLWLWDSQRARLLDIALCVDPIYCAQWRPAAAKVQRPLLAFCCGGSRVYFWSPGSSILIPY